MVVRGAGCDASATRHARAGARASDALFDPWDIMLDREPPKPHDIARPHGDPEARPGLSPRSAGAQAPVPRIVPIDRGMSQIRSVIEGLPGEPGEDHDGDLPLKLRDDPMRSFAIESFALERPDPAHPRAGGHWSIFVLRDALPRRDARPEADAFLAIMSHELRTPITTIYAGSSILAKSAHLSRPVSHTLALDISAEAARLYDLVEDLIAIARLERRALDPLDEPVLLQRVADATARIVASRAPDVDVHREGTPDPPPVRGDATYIEQAARDLALAASRFGGPGRPVTLQIEHDDGGSEVVLRVIDRGPSLSPVEGARAFDLPDESGVGRLGGGGIGPYVARTLIEAMGGRVWASNRSDGGVELGFGLPVDRD